MIIETIGTAIGQLDLLAADQPPTGANIAGELKGFFAPIVAIVIGLVGLKYLFGEDRSLAKFLGFLALGACVYGLLQFGDTILPALGRVFNSFLT